MQYRAECGACCIAPSIRSPLPQMPNGKPAGMPCIHLDVQYRCKLYGLPERPSFCLSLQASLEMCKTDREQAIIWLTQLEQLTQP